MKKVFKLFPSEWDIRLISVFGLILLPTEQGLFSKEGGCKRHAVWSFGSSSSKMVFTPLDKVIKLYVGLTTIQLWEPSLQRSFARTVWKNKWLGSRSWRSSLYDSSKDPLEVRLQVSDRWIDGGRSKSRSSRRSKSGNTGHSGSKGISVIALSGSRASGLIFANWKRVLARAKASRRSGHYVGWIESSNESSKR